MAFTELRQPASFEERRELAIRSRDEFELPMTFLIDDMEDRSRALFSDLPSPAFVIDGDGIIVDKLSWADPEALAATLATAVPKERLMTESAPAAEKLGDEEVRQKADRIVVEKSRAPLARISALAALADRASPEAARKTMETALTIESPAIPEITKKWLKRRSEVSAPASDPEAKRGAESRPAPDVKKP